MAGGDFDENDPDAVGVLDPHLGQSSRLRYRITQNVNTGRSQPLMPGVNIAHLEPEAFDRYQSQRVNIAGERIGYDPGAPTASAEWVKHNLTRVRDSLPNGYCGRPAA